MMKLTLLLLSLLLFSCSFKKSQLENQTSAGHEELYSEPEAPSEDKTDKYKRVVIAATNDLQGHFNPHDITFKDKHNPEAQGIRIGGVDIISSYFKILRQQYGDILLVDSGDILPAKTQEMHFVQDFYSLMDYDAVTVGLRDFNLKLPSKYSSSADFFKDFSSKSKTPLILSNLYELKTARIVEWPGTLPYLLREINGVKVGIIGLIPDDIPAQTPVDNRIGLFIENMLQSTLRHSRLLRSLGAEIIVVLTHQGLNCGEQLAQDKKLPLSKVNFEPERPDACELQSKLGQYLNRLPPHLVDLVIGGRNHQKVANFVNTTLVLSSYEEGKSFSYAEFFVDAKTKKLDKEKTIVHQPVFFCHEFFKETNDCYFEDKTIDHKVRTPARFLGQEIRPDLTLEQKFHYYLKNPTRTSSYSSPDLNNILKQYQGSLAYRTSDAGDSKLMLLQMSGKELSEILEEDYNQGKEKSWFPSPFHLNKKSLILFINGQHIKADQPYKVLADLDDLQSHSRLKNFISKLGSRSLSNVSWNEPELNTDDVNTTMAASDTVR